MPGVREYAAAAMSVMSSSAPDADLHVLQVGPLYVNHVRRWSERAAALGCKVSVAGHVREGRGLVDLGGAGRVEVAPEGLWELGSSRQVAWLRDVIDRLQPDLVQAHWLPTWAYLAGHAGGRPLVVTPWGSDIYLATGVDRSRADRAMSSADAVIARSAHMEREILARGVAAERVHRVDLGVDLERFRPASSPERTRLRRDLGLGDGPVVLSFRAGTPIYNLDAVLDAFATLSVRFPDATLVLLAGNAPLARDLRRSILGLQGSDRVLTLAVPHSRMDAYMRAATVGVSIPDSDGSPNSVWEGLACGLPLVLSDLPQVRERVGDAGPARFVEPRAGPLAAALDDIVADPAERERMAQAGRHWALHNADREDQVERLGLLYDRLLGKPAAVTHPAVRSVPSQATDPSSSPS